MSRLFRASALALALSLLLPARALAADSAVRPPSRAVASSPLGLPASTTVGAIAGTNSAINLIISGTEISGGGALETYQLVRATLTTSTATYYTVPASTVLSVTSITLTNRTSSPVSGVILYLGGSAAADQYTGSLTIGAYSSLQYIAGVGWKTIDQNGAESITMAGFVPLTRNVNTTSPILGGGDLSVDRTISCQVASGSQPGCISSTDWTTFNGKLGDPVDLSTAKATGVLAAGRFPALTGDCTTIAGALATTCLKTNGASFGTLATQNGTFSGTSSGTNTGDMTLTSVGSSPNANGASLAAQQLQLQVASASFPGLITAAKDAFLTAYKDTTLLLATANIYANIACDGTTDDSAAWNTIFTNAPNNSLIVMPSCTSNLVSGTNPTIPSGKHFSLQGAGLEKSIIQSSNNAADFFTVNDWYNTFQGITFKGRSTTVTNAVALSGVGISLLVGSTTGFPASGSFYVQTNLGWTLAAYTSIVDGTHFGGTTAAASTTTAGGALTVKTAGYAINAGTMAHIFLRDVGFNAVYNGWRTDGTICGISDSQISGEVNFGIEFNGSVVNSLVHNVTADGLPPAVAHIEVKQAGSLLISNSDIIRGQSDLRLNPTSPNGVFGVYAVNTYFDTATGVSGTANSGNGVLFQGTGNIQRIKIINSWMSGATHDGLWSNSTASTLPTDIEIANNNIYSNGANGIDLATVQDFIISGNQVSGNATSGVMLAAGAGAVTNGTIHHNQIGPAGGIGANGTGIVQNAGTYGNLSFDYNDLSGNTTAAQSGMPGTVTAPNQAIISHNTGMFTCPADESPAAVLPLTTVTRGGSNPCVIRPGSRIGSWARITSTMTHLSSSTATLSSVLKLGTANSNADATIMTPAALGAGTAVAGSCQDIYEFTVVSNATANVVHKWVNGNNAATGCGGVSVQNAITAPVAITSIASGGPYYLAPYYACTVASCETIQSVSYEYGQ